MNNNEEDVSGPLSGIVDSLNYEQPTSGLGAVDPAAELKAGQLRMRQLTELKARMKAQAQARQAAMERAAQAYEATPDMGMDPGLVAMAKGMVSAPGVQGAILGTQGMAEARQKLAERDWARKAAAEKLRAETEQQNMTDLLNEGKLDISMTNPIGRTFAPRDYVSNGRHMRDTFDANTGQWKHEDLGQAPSGMLKSGEKLPTGMEWIDANDHSKGARQIKGTEKLEKGMRWADSNDLSKGMVPIKGSSKDVTAVSSGDISKTGTDYLSTVPNEEQELVRSIAEGRLNPTALSTKGGHREHILGMVARYDPNYNQQRYITALKTVNDFTTGKQGNTVRSFNVALEHLDTLDELGKALANNDLTDINRLSNYFSQKTGSPKVTNFEGAKHLVADEIVKAMVGGGAALADRKAAADTISAASSPEQLSDMIETYKKLFGGQINGLKKQYEAGTGRKDFDDTFLTSQGKKMAARAGHGEANLPLANAKGWQLHTDSKGRKAYVSPDGKQFEVAK